MEQAAATSEAIILTLGLAATMQQTREDVAGQSDGEAIIDTLLQSVAASFGAMGFTGEA
jgi:hypothetical protein